MDIGPGAGAHGGKIVAAGDLDTIMSSSQSLTGDYLAGRRSIEVPAVRRLGSGVNITVQGAAQNNLRDIEVEFPLGKMTVVTGVSGSGKSSLVQEILSKGLHHELHGAHALPGKHRRILGMDQIDKVINIDQSPIGRTPRSNAATYTKVFDRIRELFAATPDARTTPERGKRRWHRDALPTRCLHPV